MKELGKCPFHEWQGERKAIFKDVNYGSTKVYCPCGATGPEVGGPNSHNNLEKAARAWNTRIADSPLDLSELMNLSMGSEEDKQKAELELKQKCTKEELDEWVRKV